MSRLVSPDHVAILEEGTRMRAPHPRRWTGRIGPRNAVWILSAVLAVLIVGTLVTLLNVESLRAAMLSTTGTPGLEVFLALGQLFGALVLVLASLDPPRPGLRWVAMGLFVLGFGSLSFGYVIPLLGVNMSPSLALYSAGSARSTAVILIVIGLVPDNPPALGRRGVLAISAAGGLATSLLLAVRNQLPPLASDHGNHHNLPELTSWHTLLGVGAIGLSVIALWGAVRQVLRRSVSGWLVVGMVVLAGSQLHAMFWPSMYSTVMSSTTFLRLGWTLVVVLGAVLELYALSRERSTLLSREQERVRQLQELGAMKRDFTSMVAHELGTPLAAIGNLSQIITMGVLSETEQQKLAGRIMNETRLLQILVRDFQESNTIEQDDFSVDRQRVSLRTVLEDAYAYAETVRRNNPMSLEIEADAYVIADPDRISQVIRNLLNNAVRHTPAGTPIRLCAVREEAGIRVSVVDHGPGIPVEDRARILEKFGRGSTASAAGTGLGLYLSRRILRAHGSDIMIESEPGCGSSFSFLLEESR